MRAAASGTPESIDLLIEAGASVQQCAIDGSSALHYASGAGAGEGSDAAAASTTEMQTPEGQDTLPPAQLTPEQQALVAAMPPVVLLAITHLTVHMYQKRAEAAKLREDAQAIRDAEWAASAESWDPILLRGLIAHPGESAPMPLVGEDIKVASR